MASIYGGADILNYWERPPPSTRVTGVGTYATVEALSEVSWFSRNLIFGFFAIGSKNIIMI